jgi:putative chitinase
MHESRGFERIAESTYYSTPAIMKNAFVRLRKLSDDQLRPFCREPMKFANLVYAHINGNGNESSGDGYAFRGGGIFQNTGRDAYRRVGAALGVDLENNPELLRTDPLIACLAAGWYWTTNKFSALADADRFDEISNILNTGRRDRIANGAKERRTLYERALPVFSPL